MLFCIRYHIKRFYSLLDKTKLHHENFTEIITLPDFSLL